MRKLFITITLLLSFHSVFGSEVIELLKIRDISNGEQSTLWLETKNDMLEKIKLVTPDETLMFDYQQVMKEVTLVKEMGINVITLKGHNMTKMFGGSLKLKYLKNFSILGSDYGLINLTISKPSGTWKISHKNIPVSLLDITPHAYGIQSYEFK